jgi:hypothetical protein
MNIGKLVKGIGGTFIKDLSSGDLHHVDSNEFKVGEYYSYEINENDDAVDLLHAAEALIDWGITPDTGSFYCTADDDEAESFFGTCELTGIKGNVVPCLYRSPKGDIVQCEFGDWLVHSVLGKFAGAF